jgi:opacity protein-like surface antigen
MRVKSLFVGAAVAAALLGAAVVQAATSQQVFRGDFEAQADSSVKLKTGANNDYRVKVFGARDFTIDCGAEDGIIERATLKGRIPIGNRGGFHARDDNGETVLNVRGEIDGRNAEGVFRFSGEIEDQDGVDQDCDSGLMEWSARAPAS